MMQFLLLKIPVYVYSCPVVAGLHDFLTEGCQCRTGPVCSAETLLGFSDSITMLHSTNAVHKKWKFI